MTSSAGTSTWEPWWAFNRDPYLNLKAVIHEGDPSLGSESYFLGHVPLALIRDQLGPTDEVVQERIVPALERILEEETDNDIVTGALVALAKIGVPSADRRAHRDRSDLLRSFLDSPNQEIAETAAVSLGILADETSVVLLSELLRDSEKGRGMVGDSEVNWRTRAFAAFGLGLIGFYSDGPDLRRRILHELRSQLEGGAAEMATPDVAVACLTAMGLVRLDVDSRCLLVSAKCPSPTHCRRGQIEWLREFARDGDLDYVVRSHVPTTLARLVEGTADDPQLAELVVRDLLQWARNSSKIQRHLRASSIMALGMIGSAEDRTIDQEIVATLTGVAKESRLPEVRSLALVALGQVGGRRGPGGGVDEATVEGVREFLLSSFTSGRSSDRGWSALALSLLEAQARKSGLAPSVAIAEELRKALRAATSPAQVGAYAVALGVMQDVDANELLLSKLAQLSDDRSRGYICIGLGLMNARESIEPLRQLLETCRYRPLLMREAAISLGLLGDKHVVADLVDELHRSTSLTAQASIASALGTIGDARSVGPLLEMLEDGELNVRARAFAAVALGIVADKEPLPWNSKIAVGTNYLAGTPTLTDGQGAGILDIL